MNTMLLATFTKQQKLRYTIDKITKNFEVLHDKIFVLKDVDNPYNRIVTFNIEKKDDLVFDESLKSTISLHRKKETNTLYTLNALNAVVEKQNNGQKDNKFAVNWDGYENSILLMSKEDDENMELKKIRTKLVEVIDL